MYIRFITQFINDDNEYETGIFHALRHICEHSLTSKEDVNELKALNRWFNANLDKPTKFSNATNKNPASISLSWFKDTAKEHLLKTNDIIKILERYDLIIERLISKNPGYIVYEDDHQVSAIPFKIDRTKVL
jgi:hypothetical protein